jgi:hypothetical protein
MDRSRPSQSWPWIQVLTLFTLAGCGVRSSDAPKADPGCPATGQEKFSLHLDGVYSGLFNSLEDPSSPDHPGVAVFRDGVIFKGGFVKAWIKTQTQSPPLRVPETHDATVFDVDDVVVKKRQKTFTETLVQSLDAAPYLGDDSCLIVKKLELKVKKTVKYSHGPSSEE